MMTKREMMQFNHRDKRVAGVCLVTAQHVVCNLSNYMLLCLIIVKRIKKCAHISSNLRIIECIACVRTSMTERC